MGKPYKKPAKPVLKRLCGLLQPWWSMVVKVTERDTSQIRIQHYFLPQLKEWIMVYGGQPGDDSNKPYGLSKIKIPGMHNGLPIVKL